jgi:hypothetical protein
MRKSEDQERGGLHTYQLELEDLTLTTQSDANQQQAIYVQTIYSQAPIIEPVVAHRAHNEPISDVIFLEDGMATCCWAGISKFWARPGSFDSVVSILFWFFSNLPIP